MNLITEGDRALVRNIKGILFDLDGTLIHLNVDFGRMRERVETLLPRFDLSTEGKDHLYTLELVEESAQTLAQRDGDGTAEAFRREAEAAIVAVEMEAAATARIHQGVPELLQRLRRQGIKVAIITRNCRAAVEQILQRNPLPHDLLVTRDDVEEVKPNPAHLLTALRRLDITPEQALMVGDHPMDIRAGRVVGTYTVAVLTGYSPMEHFVSEQPDLILKHVGELEEHLAFS